MSLVTPLHRITLSRITNRPTLWQSWKCVFTEWKLGTSTDKSLHTCVDRWCRSEILHRHITILDNGMNSTPDMVGILTNHSTTEPGWNSFGCTQLTGRTLQMFELRGTTQSITGETRRCGRYQWNIQDSLCQERHAVFGDPHRDQSNVDGLSSDKLYWFSPLVATRLGLCGYPQQRLVSPVICCLWFLHW